jgi:hypothetical protein
MAFGEFVPVSTQSGYTLAGAWNAEAAADGPLQAATRLPNRVEEFQGLFARPGVDEPELDRRLRERALEFAADRPGYLPEAARLNLTRLFGLGGDPAFTDAWNRERDVRGWQKPVSAIGLAVVAALGLLALARRASRALLRRAPLWLWLVPVLLVASTVPLLGNPRHRATLDAFLVLVASVAVAKRLWRVRTGSAAPGEVRVP